MLTKCSYADIPLWGCIITLHCH